MLANNESIWDAVLKDISLSESDAAATTTTNWTDASSKDDLSIVSSESETMTLQHHPLSPPPPKSSSRIAAALQRPTSTIPKPVVATTAAFFKGEKLRRKYTPTPPVPVQSPLYNYKRPSNVPNALLSLTSELEWTAWIASLEKQKPLPATEQIFASRIVRRIRNRMSATRSRNKRTAEVQALHDRIDDLAQQNEELIRDITALKNNAITLDTTSTSSHPFSQQHQIGDESRKLQLFVPFESTAEYDDLVGDGGGGESGDPTFSPKIKRRRRQQRIASTRAKTRVSAVAREQV